MLDKSIEFHSIIMKNKNNSIAMVPALPDGFSMRFYKDGDEKHWAKIQTAVLEFETYVEDTVTGSTHCMIAPYWSK